MADETQLFPVQLANFTAWGFAVPESLNWGGAQRLGVHQLPNGVRVIDSMGPDDSDINWKGMFLKRSPGEPNPVDAARYIDFLRKQGSPTKITWDAFDFDVVVEQFKPSYEFPTRVSFDIVLKVIQDNTAPGQNFAAPQIDDLMRDDFSNILGLVSFLNMAVAAGLPGSFSSSASALPTATGVYFLGGDLGPLTALTQPGTTLPVPMFISATDAQNYVATHPGQYADFLVTIISSTAGILSDTLTLTATNPDGSPILTFASLGSAQQYLAGQPPGFSARYVDTV